jgi:rSAM/selenodomain-associated transferase 1
VDEIAGAADRSKRCAIAIMAKEPRAGRTKTRLSPFLTAEEAKDLGCCFLTDMTGNLATAAREVPLDAYIAFAPAESEAAFASIVQGDIGFILADGSSAAPAQVEGFGRCLLQAARSLFNLGYGSVGLLNSDSPTLPTSSLVQAVRLLLQREEIVVLGPSVDGGYYFLGMNTLHPNLFCAIDWSTAHVARQTRIRAGESGLKLVDLDAWYDIDDAVSLRQLIDELDGISGSSSDRAGFPAAATAAWLCRNQIRQRLATRDESFVRASRATYVP